MNGHTAALERRAIGRRWRERRLGAVWACAATVFVTIMIVLPARTLAERHALPARTLAERHALPARTLAERHALGSQAAGAGVTIADGIGDQRAPALAFGGDRYLAIWETCVDCPVSGADLAVRPLGLDGVPSGPAIVVEDTPLDARSPALAYNPDEHEYLAVWSVRYPGVADRYGVRARRLAPDGRPISDTVRVAEVVGVWPAAVVSSRGAWHGYDIAWAAPGPQPLLATTVIHTRHLDADGNPAAEVWQLSDPGYEALRPRSLRTSGGAGALVAWFAYQPTQHDEPRLRGIRLGLSGRPIGTAGELIDGAVCEAALADNGTRPELLLATIGCDGRLMEPSGAMSLARLNRTGATIDEPLFVTETVVARDMAVAAASNGDYLVVRPDDAAVDPISQTLTVQRFGADLSWWRPADELGVGEGPAIAGDDRDGGLVLAARHADDWDVVGYAFTRPPTATATDEPDGTPTGTPTGTRTPGATIPTTSTAPTSTTRSTPQRTADATPVPTGGSHTAVPTVPSGTAGTGTRITLPLALRRQ